MAKSLLERGPEFIARVVGHPAQLRACEIVAELLDRLRGIKTPAELYEDQRELFGVAYQAEERRAEAVRSLKRARRGKQVAAAPSGGWELERAVWDRVIRQFRNVGDALAWRLFRYDRRLIIALAQNPAPGLLLSKEGLPY